MQTAFYNVPRILPCQIRSVKVKPEITSARPSPEAHPFLVNEDNNKASSNPSSTSYKPNIFIYTEGSCQEKTNIPLFVFVTNCRDEGLS